MIMRGDVHMENGMYIYEDKGVEVDELKKEIKNLTDKLGRVSNEDIESELEEAKVQWEYYQGLYENELLDKQKRIRKCFQWIKQIKPNADWEEFRDWVMED